MIKKHIKILLILLISCSNTGFSSNFVNLKANFLQQDCIIDDSNIHAAVDLWISDQTTAEVTYGHISTWDTSCVTNMSELFKDFTEFNDDISNWDTSGVTNMQAMFQNASSFNQPLNNWDVSNVTDMSLMFTGASSEEIETSLLNVEISSFNQPLNNWNVGNVTNMEHMFSFTRIM